MTNWADATTPDTTPEKHAKHVPDDLPRWDEGCPTLPGDHASTAPPVPAVPTDGSERAA